MANAATTAPSKPEVLTGEKKIGKTEQEYLDMTFDQDKKYVFQLVAENPERELPVMDARINRPLPHDKFKPFQNLVYTSQIVWNGQRRNIRYYDGCTTIFVDEQPDDKELMADLIKGTVRRNFLKGKLSVGGDEKQLVLYLMMCSWNQASPFKTRTSDTIFVTSDSSKAASAKAAKVDAMEEALGLAKKATVDKMIMHCNYLGIPLEDYDSGNELTPEEIRALYREEAARNPIEFTKTYGDKTIEIKYYISKALNDGTIHNKFNANKATWGKSNSEICDISGLKTHDGIAEKLFEFSQMEAGADFLTQLKSLYN